MGLTSTMPGHTARHRARDYALTPMNVYWEMTQACALACRHCRAEAMPGPHPLQLTHDESIAFLRQIPGFGDPLPQLILTGGDPLARADLYELIDEATGLGISVSITPAVTPQLTQGVLARLKDRGVQGLGISLDGASAELHDSIRGIAGTFDRTMQVLRWATDLHLTIQVNTLITAETVGDLPAMYKLLQAYGVRRWSLFFLISVGRGRVLQPLSPEQGEELMQWIFDISREAPFIVATTEAPSYRRVALSRMRELGWKAEQIRQAPVSHGFGIRDGHGIMFVSNTGEICPAGFLPVSAGNVRIDDVVTLYRQSPLFSGLHDPTTFSGKCGDCEFATICGGSRARAFSATGDPFASDPFCPYQPERVKG